MKKILGCILCGMLIVFLAMPAAADMLVVDNDEYVDTSDDYFGEDLAALWGDEATGWGDTNPDRLANSGDDTELAWLRSLLDLDRTDTTVYLISRDAATDLDPDVTNDVPESWTYAILKYGTGGPPAVDHWAVMDDGNYVVDFGSIVDESGFPVALPDFESLSHITYFGPQGVPEPATMFLLGTGLVVLAGFGRKKFLK